MTLFNGTWRRRGALITAAAAGVISVGLTAGPAGAHTPVWSNTCSQVTVDLTAYGNKPGNTISVTADGKSLLPDGKDVVEFKGEYHNVLDIPEHHEAVQLAISVKAADGKNYDYANTATAAPCEGDDVKPASPSATTPTKDTDTEPVSEKTPAETPSDQPSETAAPSSDASSPAAAAPAASPSDTGEDLAETGSSSSTPIIAGGAAVVLVAGAGILWASRRRRATQG